MKYKSVAILVVVTLVFLLSGYLIFTTKTTKNLTAPTNGVTQQEAVDTNPFSPAKFTTKITNKFFALPVGRELTYEGQTEDGFERVVISIPGESKTIMGIETLVYRDKVWVDGELIEDTRDYLAEDKEGNVWYFGEDVDNYEDGELIDHAGSWIAGVDGAEPGIWIKAVHTVGDSYKQEYYKGNAEDMRDVVSIDEDVTTKLGKYTNCVKMYDWTPLDAESKEHKYYCAEVGAMVLETNILTGEKLELVKVL